ncbi:Gfo/Idh/MocA family oxidoreductase [Roseovarius sp. CAU 1744]|uniref:Gfo/Idh/MocA family protein n=1 Tax=Roseovarius sp. CAU 1744 TaxID=3140368 RepID=UPI00325B6F2A
MADQIKLGIVGTGRMASRMMQALATVPEFAVQGVASGSGERARAFAEAFGIPHNCASAAELAGNADVDAVYICGRSGNHTADALAAIEAGKPTLLEKPLATGIEDATRLTDAARGAKILLLENLWCLALPTYRRLSEGLNSQSYGKAVQLQFSFGYPVTPQAYPSLFDPTDGGALLDRGVYGVSLALHLLGPVNRVQASAQLNGDGVDLTTDINLEHYSGATSQISVSLNALMSNTATLSCTHGSMQLGAPVVGSESFLGQQMTPESGAPSDGIHVPSAGLKDRLKANRVLRKLKRLKDASAAQFLPHGADQYAPMLTHFRDLIRQGLSESALVPLELSLNTQGVLAEARQQIKGT